MELLKEMYAAIKYAEEIMESDTDKSCGKMPKARNKQVNDVLMSKRSERHHDKKSDYKRSASKSDSKKTIDKELD